MLHFKLTQTNERITGRAGLAFIGEFCEWLNLPEILNFYLPAPGSKRGYAPDQFVVPLLLTLIGGGEALDHTRQLSKDKALEKLLSLEALPDPDTLGKWLSRVYERGYAGLDQVNQWVLRTVLEADKGKSYTLDPDATGIESHKRDAKITYKGYPGYMPMLAVLSEVGLWLVDDFREGNVPPQAQALAILDKALERMPPSKRIGYLRSDSAWYQAEIFNRCEEKQITFAITADQDSAVKEAISRIENWQPLRDKDGFQTGREWGECVHCMGKTKIAFRLIGQRWPNPNRSEAGKAPYCHHAIASNHSGSGTEVIHWHNGRANSENCNKELKLGFAMERLPCGNFGANAMYFRIGVLAYNLIAAMKALVLPKACQTQTIATMRWLWIQTPAKLIYHGRQWILKLDHGADQLYQWWNGLRRKHRSCLW
jgi:hypothetical protein